MRALTVCHPFAALCVLPDSDPRRKRCENREWSTKYIGELLIHAGKSTSWMKYGTFDLEPHEMVFGAIIGICWLEGCAKITPQYKQHMSMQTANTREWPNVVDAESLARWPWLEYDEHAHGKYGLILTKCKAFPKPVPYRGAQGFFDVPRTVVAEQLEAVGWTGKT